MSDLIERLRAGCPQQFVGDGSDNYEANQVAADAMMAEAADTIASLTEEVDRLKTALRPFSTAAECAEVSGRPPMNFVGASDYAAARAALQSTEQRT